MAAARAERRATRAGSRQLPWGIRFRYESSGGVEATLPVVRARVAGQLPGWDIRRAADQGAAGGWFEAVPAPLPAHLANDPSYAKDFEERLKEGLACLEGIKEAADPTIESELPEALVCAFLEDERPRSGSDRAVVTELASHIAGDPALRTWLQRWRPGSLRLPLLHRLVRSLCCSTEDGQRRPPANALCAQLTKLELYDQKRLKADQRVDLVDFSELAPEKRFALPEPPARHLRAYSFDPSLATTLDTAPIHQVTIPTRWEAVEPGPIGDYLEVVDVDYASGCAYLPVDLEHPYVIAQDGLAPSEGNPQFHQQMVYAVAMNTVHRFEQALGRPIFWSPLRPWFDEEEATWFTPAPDEAPDEPCVVGAEDVDADCPCKPLEAKARSRYIQRLRIYPHALREANAFYSPTKRALLFGYFPNEGENNGMVFTCLSHDIIVHETTHAIVDGMHSYFAEPSNEDVLAFHEAFADIMALFQHFTYPEVLRHQIATTRGDLETDNLLGQMAQQFGQATGRRGGLRNYLGKRNEKGDWERTKPDPQALRGAREPHERGSILVAAVFDAFLALYHARVQDLLRISTGGTGVLPTGRIHPDLANRLAEEAAQAAEEVLSICIRAMDYVPPVDITFGEFLRALITADYERSPTTGQDNRIAFIDAFRSWGIYPRDVTTLSEESLRWSGPEPGFRLQERLRAEHAKGNILIAQLKDALETWRPGSELRECLFSQVVAAQAGFFCFLRCLARAEEGRDILKGIDLTKPFNVDNMRPTRSIGPQGEVRVAMIVEVVQEYVPEESTDSVEPPIRGGVTLIIDLQTWEIRYTIYKRLYEEPASRGDLAIRGQRLLLPTRHTTRRAETSAGPVQRLAATYAPVHETSRHGHKEPFALLHRSF